MNSTIYKRKAPLLLFLLPALAFMGIFLYYPFFMNVLNSFQQISELGAAAEGINAPWYENYARLFSDPLMATTMKNTMLMILFTVVFQVGIALILSLLVDNIKKGAGFFRTAYFFPIVISATALGLMFNLIFMMEGGMINQLLQHLGLQAMNNPTDWKDESHARYLPCSCLSAGNMWASTL